MTTKRKRTSQSLRFFFINIYLIITSIVLLLAGFVVGFLPQELIPTNYQGVAAVGMMSLGIAILVTSNRLNREVGWAQTATTIFLLILMILGVVLARFALFGVAYVILSAVVFVIWLTYLFDQRKQHQKTNAVQS